MTLNRIACVAVFVFAQGLAAITAQVTAYTPQPSSNTVHLNVVVADKSGTLVPNLSQQDFTILDNKRPQAASSFKVVSSAQEPVEVIILLDAVNTPFSLMNVQSIGVQKFLRLHEGKLDHPTTLAISTDKGTQIGQEPYDNGMVAADDLAQNAAALRLINGSYDRLLLSVRTLHQLTAYAANYPGRKLVLWISPGWPLISGANVLLGSKQEEAVFNEVVSLSTQMRSANMTLYNLNPVDEGESLGSTNYYQVFLNDIAKPSQVKLGNIGLQVLAVQSGGLTIEGNSDIPGIISRCLADASTWYEIDYDPPQSAKPDEYHRIEVKVNHPGLTARTRENYYANPNVDPPR